MLLSLVYNHGSKLTGARRKEMLAIKRHVKKQDLDSIAKEFQSMKRLWQDKGLEGLLHRRDSEAIMIKKSKRRYKESDFVYL
ncbi:MAG: GH24 family phage-related lysozyme (muramidase) [Cocleimonas sp.]|jgi:GH24 family phage-related lysozyme (muramidase)